MALLEPLPQPSLRDVVPAAAAEAQLARARGELESVQQELAAIEAEVREAERRADDPGLSSPYAMSVLRLVESGNEQLLEASRAELGAMVADAEARAAQQVLAAEETASRLVADARSAFSAALLDRAESMEAEAAVWETLIDLTGDPGDADVATSMPAPEPVSTAPVAPIVEDVPPMPEAEARSATGSDPDADIEQVYERFWQEEAAASVARPTSFVPVEVILPMVALVVLLIVILVVLG